VVPDACEGSMHSCGALHERQLHQSRPEHEGGDATHAEEQHDDERPTKHGVAQGERRHRERKHRDGVDHPEREDGKSDRVEAESYTAQPAQRPDLDDVVQTERQHHSARRGRAARGKAAAAIGPFADEEPLPAERSQEEAREIRGRRGDDEHDVRILQRPARRREPARGEETRRNDHDGEGDTSREPQPVPRGASGPSVRHARGST